MLACYRCKFRSVNVLYVLAKLTKSTIANCMSYAKKSLNLQVLPFYSYPCKFGKVHLWYTLTGELSGHRPHQFWELFRKTIILRMRNCVMLDHMRGETLWRFWMLPFIWIERVRTEPFSTRVCYHPGFVDDSRNVSSKFTVYLAIIIITARPHLN